MEKKKAHAIALFSGGLDSSLAILLMRQQGIEVTALSFLTHFGCDLSDRSSCGHNPYPVAEKFGFTVKLVHLGMEYVEAVKKPRYGHGKNMNICIDCRLIMLSKAKEYMELTGADFVITGEVLGQRPMSQRWETLRMTDKQSGLQGRLLRPLSAKLLPPTVPELEGLVDREKLLDIEGRSRHRQMELAKELGLEDYPSPASGCLLTDPGYSQRLRDLLAHKTDADFTDINLLRVGRHFRLSPTCKVIVGRNDTENQIIKGLMRESEWLLEVRGTGSPAVLFQLVGTNGNGSPDPEWLLTAARLTARYCDLKNQPEVEVTVTQNGSVESLTVSPSPDDLVNSLRI